VRAPALQMYLHMVRLAWPWCAALQMIGTPLSTIEALLDARCGLLLLQQPDKEALTSRELPSSSPKRDCVSRV
jgi:hypothetical protein